MRVEAERLVGLTIEQNISLQDRWLEAAIENARGFLYRCQGYLRASEQAYQKALKQLPDDARTIYVLKEIEGLSYAEIARILNIKKGTVSSRLFYARQRLQKALKSYRESI